MRPRTPWRLGAGAGLRHATDSTPLFDATTRCLAAACGDDGSTQDGDVTFDHRVRPGPAERATSRPNGCTSTWRHPRRPAATCRPSSSAPDDVEDGQLPGRRRELDPDGPSGHRGNIEERAAATISTTNRRSGTSERRRLRAPVGLAPARRRRRPVDQRPVRRTKIDWEDAVLPLSDHDRLHFDLAPVDGDQHTVRPARLARGDTRRHRSGRSQSGDDGRSRRQRVLRAGAPVAVLSMRRCLSPLPPSSCSPAPPPAVTTAATTSPSPSPTRPRRRRTEPARRCRRVHAR